MQEFVEFLKGLLEKVGTVLTDRRAWVTALVLLALQAGGLLGLDETTRKMLEDLFNEAYAGIIGLNGAVLVLVVVVGKILALVLPLLGLLASWTQRPPSGYKNFRLLK